MAGDETFRPANPLVKTVIPRDLDEGIAFSELGYDVRPSGASSTDPLEAANGRVLATNLVADTDLLIAPTPTGIETTLFVRSEEAPEASALQFDFKRGQKLRERETPDGKVIEIVNADGQPVATVQAPAGRDANDEPVPVTLELEGETKVVVRYPHRSGDYAMPIAVDPVIDNYQIDPNASPSSPAARPAGASMDPFFFWTSQTGGGDPNPQFASYKWNVFKGNGYPYGNGLFVNGTGLIQDRYGQWLWRAPLGSYVKQVTFGFVRHDSNYTCLNEGVWNVSAGRYETGTWQDSDGTTGTSPWTTNQGGGAKDACANQYDDYKTHTIPSPSKGNQVVFGANAYYNFVRNPQALAFMYGASMVLDEKDPPAVGSVEIARPGGSPIGSEWIDGSGQVDVTASIAELNGQGLGAKKMYVDADIGGRLGEKVHPCSGGKDNRCPTLWNKTGSSGQSSDTTPAKVAVDLDAKRADGTHVLPDGSRSLRVSASDVVDNLSTNNPSATLKVDRSAPEIDLAGDLFAKRDVLDSEGETTGGLFAEEPAAVEVSATDSGSGVASVQLLVDGEQLDQADMIRTTCASTGCPATAAASLSVSAGDVDPGTHTITVVVRDQLAGAPGVNPAQHTSSESFNIYIDQGGDKAGDEDGSVSADDFAGSSSSSGPASARSGSSSNPVLDLLSQQPPVDDAALSPVVYGSDASTRSAPSASAAASDPTKCNLDEAVIEDQDLSTLSPTDTELNGARYGIGDAKPLRQNSNIFVEQPVKDLGLKRVRLAVPYDLVIAARRTIIRYDTKGRRLPNDACLTYSRIRFYIALMAQQKREVLVSFERRRVPRPNAPAMLPERAPGLDQVPANNKPNSNVSSVVDYKTAVEAFMERFPTVRHYGAWNEPNFRDQPTRAAGTGEQRTLGPLMAARYWRQLDELCQQRNCAAVAGEFSDSKEYFTPGYLDVYKAGLEEDIPGLGKRPPVVWGFHPYASIVSGMTARFEGWLRRPEVRQAPGGVWITEVGSYLTRGAEREPETGPPRPGKRYSEDQQADRLRSFFRRFTDRTADNRQPQIKRFYYYQWYDANQGKGEATPGLELVSDTGLTDPHMIGALRSDDIRLVYDVYKRRTTGQGDSGG